MPDFVHAEPTKRFFIEMLTRDISLEAAIVDLVDNSIDSLARTRGLPLDEALLDEKTMDRKTKAFRDIGIPKIDITIDKKHFSIEDNCGGISYKNAKDEVFRFGRVADPKKSRLSVYGIGLKRAVFKIGRDIAIESKTTRDGFLVEINVDDWAKTDSWQFPIDEKDPAKTDSRAGTRITIKKLTDDVEARIDDGKILNNLHELISRAYTLLIDRFVHIYINGARVKAQPIPIGLSSKVTPAREKFDYDGVRITMVAGLSERSIDGEWTLDRAGWYVLCNGRTVVFADKSEHTGWGVGLPQFVSKYRGFVGVVFLFSEDPESLPWTTTKRGLNLESRLYQRVRNRMAVLARPVVTFLNNMYPSGDVEEPGERAIASTVKQQSISKVLRESGKTFLISKPERPTGPPMVSIQYKIEKERLELAKKILRKPSWAATRVGEYTFNYFLEHEGPK